MEKNTITTKIFLKQKQVYITVFLLVLFLVFPYFSKAAGLIPCGNTGEEPCQVIDVFILVARVTNWLLRMASIYAVLKIVQAGFWFTVSQGDEEAISKNKTQIQNAVLGFCLSMIAYMLVNTVVNVIFLKGVKNCTVDLTQAWTYLNVDEKACRGIK